MSDTLEDAAVERAETSTEVVALGELPTVGAWQQMCQMAVTFAESSLVPRSMYRKPADVLLVFMAAHDLGIGVTNALSQCYVIDSKVTISPKLRLALLNNSGRGTIRPHPDNTAESCTAVVYDSDRKTEIGLFTLTRDDVPQDLLKKQNWRQYPKRMLWWRCLGYAIDDFFPEAGIGLYSADELGAVTDEEGEPIDLDSVPRPFESKSVPPPRPDEPSITSETLAELNAIMDRIASDESVKTAAADVWIKRFEKQPRSTFTQKQGVTAIRLMGPYADQVATDAVIVDDGPPACSNCGKPADSVDHPGFCSVCEPF